MKKIIFLIAILAAMPAVAQAKDLWYSTEEQERIDQQAMELESQISDLRMLTRQLQAKVEQTALDAQTEVTNSVQQVIETREIVIQPDNDRVEALEKRVGTLEKAVSFIQNQVLSAIGNLIAMIKKFL